MEKLFLKIKKKSLLFGSTFKNNKSYQVWMSHTDAVKKLPKDFESIASSDNCESAVIENKKKKFMVCSSILKWFTLLKVK